MRGGAFRSAETIGSMVRGHARTGILTALRRKAGGVGVLLFSIVFLVGLLRGEALALTVGDQVCIFMGGSLPPRTFESDPSDLSDRSHDCCDLGLCLAGTALPPSEPAPLALPRAIARLRRSPRPRAATPRTSRHDHRPRGPPASTR